MKKLISSMLLSLGLLGCANSNTTTTNDYYATWNITAVTCNGTNVLPSLSATGVASSFVISQGSLVQRQTESSCTQMVTTPVSIANDQMTISSGAVNTKSCSPSPCSTSNLSQSNCSGTATQGSTYTFTLALSNNNNTLTMTSSNASTCGNIGASNPYVITLSR